MARKSLSSSEELNLVRNTLEVRDPDRITVSVGSVALVAQLYDRGVESPIGCEDVDVLCSEEFFDDLLRTGPFMDDINKFQVRWPKGRLKERGATNKSIDIYPANKNVLPFTACHSMSDLWYPIDYESCQDDVVEASGIRCLSARRVLEWISVIGRQKDVEVVDAVLPLARQARLVDEKDHLKIIKQLDMTKELRAEYPERYFAQTDL
jgi:hypothetical protein